MTIRMRAAVAREPHGTFSVEDLELSEPGEGEVLVRLVATGMCHTDISVIEQIIPLQLPLVLGHEGAGVVEKIGPGVTTLNVGDHVVLTFASCGHCRRCDSGHPAYCEHYAAMNFAGCRPDGSTVLTDADSNRIGSMFYSQSSFAPYSVALAKNAIPVRKDAPLELLGPLGCGYMTGAGTVLEVLKPAPDTKLAVFGTGAVGCAAIMAAKAMGVETIIAIDKVAERLALAREQGASFTVDTSWENLSDALAALGGVDQAIDTSGVPRVVEAAVASLNPCGTLVLLGASHENDITLPILPLISGRSVRGIVNGDCKPEEMIPRLVDMHMDGTFPIERISGFYDIEDINQAMADSQSGKVIKPIITFGGHP